MSECPVVILGCGIVGGLAGRILVGRGHQVVGVRRHSNDDVGFPLIVGDAADPAVWKRLPHPSAVLLTATPGLRGGGDNRLAAAAAAIPSEARVVYSGTTAVYGDADGAAVAEDGPFATGAAELLAVEAAVLAHAGALVLRCPALVGPNRVRVQERARQAAAAGQPLRVPGEPDRPFSVLPDDDLAGLLAEAVDGRLAGVHGVWNAATPQRLTVREYYALQANRAGVTVDIASDGSAKPSRAIDAGRLHALLPDWPWRAA